MEKNLFIKNIPLTKNALKEVLHIIGDNSWGGTAIDGWIKQGNGEIFYNDDTNDYSYSYSVFDLSHLIEKDYFDIVNRNKTNKTIGELEIKECTKISDSFGNKYTVMRIENGYIYTNESNNMVFVPSNEILI